MARFGAGGPERGYDGAKRLAGRKRHLLVDTNGLVLTVGVHGADLHDRDGGMQLLARRTRDPNCPG
jgi:putative transposase